MAPCATGTGSPWAGFFDPEPSMLVLVYLNFRQPSRWELGSALPGFLGTGSQCPGLRPRPRMSQPCFPQAGPRKPRQTHHAAGSTSNHLSRAAPPGLCPFSQELGRPCLQGLLVTTAQWLASGTQRSPWTCELLLLLPWKSPLCLEGLTQESILFLLK